MAGTEAVTTPDDDDPFDLLRADVLDLARVTLRKLRMDLEYGSVTQRNAAIKLITPYLLRTLDASNEQDQLAAVKEAIVGLMSDLRGKT